MAYKVGWFSTGRDPAARNLLTAVYDRRGSLGIEIPFIFSNWGVGEEPGHGDSAEREKFFGLVKDYGIDLVTLPWMGFEPELRKVKPDEWRADYGREMRGMLAGQEHDIDVLAGYMLWVDDETCAAFDMLNLHPALPGGPKGTWQEVIWELIDRRAKRQGAMMHLVTKEWDRGPPVSYCSFPIRGGEYNELWKGVGNRNSDAIKGREGEENGLFMKIRKEGEIREIPLIIDTIGLFSRGDVRIDSSGPEKMVVSGEEALKTGYDITGLVNREIQGGR